MKKIVKSHRPRGLNRVKIRELYKDGWCVASLARKFHCHINAIQQHVFDLTVPQKSMRRSNAKLSDSEVKEIRKLAIDYGYSSPLLSKKFSVSESTILNVIKGKFYRYIPGKVRLYSEIITIPENFVFESVKQNKGRHKCGPNKNTVRLVSPGSLKPVAKKYGVATCTISRWLRKGILQVKSGCIKKVK